MSFTEIVIETFDVIECAECHVRFATTHSFDERCLTTGEWFYCPSGHRQQYRKPRLKVLEEQLEEKRKELTAARCDILKEKNEKEAIQKDLNKHKTRTNNGVCPYCQRSFQSLRRHMASKHPKFLPAPPNKSTQHQG